MAKVKSIFLIGNTGWIGHYCIQYIYECFSDLVVTGTHSSRPPNTDRSIQFSHDNPNELFGELEANPPDVFINLSRGENEQAYENHKRLIRLFNETRTHYAYCSSSNAVDAILDRPHEESEVGNAQSEYGKFKVRCEKLLFDNSNSFSIYRFSATHGHAPNREGRTAEFLSKLAAGEKVPVHRGVIQNRLFVADLAKLIVDLSVLRKQGLYHLGTEDSSEEIEFLAKLAEHFGYPRSQIVDGEDARCNLTVTPNKIRQELNAEFYEAETLQKLASQNELQHFKHERLLA